MKDTADPNEARKGWMGLLAKAPEGRAAALLDGTLTRPTFTWLRPPEIGSSMVRGRQGGSGAPFNLGEITITRCALRLESGEIGHAYIQGRRKTDAETAALIDALMQTAKANNVQDQVLAILASEQSAARRQRAEKAAATKVDFFTMVRGED